MFRSAFDRTARLMWSPRRLTVLAFVLGCVIAMMLLLGAWTAHVGYINCQRVQHIEAVTERQLTRTLKTLPTLTYYREHPAELQHTIQQIDQESKDFAPVQCSLWQF